MKNQQKNDWIIDFYRLPIGQTQLKIQLDNLFFQEKDYDEFVDMQVEVLLTIQKKDQFSSLVSAKLQAKGHVPCDYCLQPLELLIHEEEMTSIYWEEEVEEFDDSKIGHWRVPMRQDVVDCGQWLYELIVAAVPMRRSHADCVGKLPNIE